MSSTHGDAIGATTEKALTASVLADVGQRIMRGFELTETLDAIVGSVTDTLGFDIAVLNMLSSDRQSLKVVAISGPASSVTALTGQHESLENWTLLIEASEKRGSLCFLDHSVSCEALDSMAFWTPDIPEPTDPGGWHPDDVLFAPLYGADETLVGVLSVDVPQHGRQPSAEECRLLEIFAAQAGIAIERAELHSRLAASADLFGAVFAQSPIAIALLDEDLRYLHVNDAFCRFLGRDRTTLLGLGVRDLTHPDDTETSLTWMHAHLRGEAPALEKRYLLPNGDVVWGRVRTTRLQTIGDDFRLLSQIEDITETKAHQERLVHDALHDPLTGLPNRALLLDRLEGALARAERSGSLVAVLFCDLDYFKLVNDTHGHATGDALILAVAARLRTALRDPDTAGRFGGDEFVILAENLNSVAEAVGLAERLSAVIRTPVTLCSTQVTPSVSIGIATAGTHVNAERLLGDADAALYRAKAAGRGGWQLFDEPMRQAATSELQLRSELSAALARGELTLHYQPIVTMAEPAVVGYEALLHWQHPSRGLLLPAAFVQTVLGSDLESPITDWVIDEACAFAASWPADAVAPYISVNLSTQQLARDDLLPRILDSLRTHRLPSNRLMIEITEDRLLEHENHTRQVSRLRQLGVRVAMDDFGIGYASLSALTRLPVDTVKIDRSFVAALPGDQVSATIVSSVAVLARLLGLTVIADGVDTTEQADALAFLGVKQAQGRLFGWPAPVVDVPVRAQAG
jgi:diguanylate cyclase (GGDEF)-like protein/PAS domain S-box-containing protein